MDDRKAGRPPLRDESQRRDKKVMLTFTESEYMQLQKMQILLNKPTLTSTIQFFVERGMSSLVDELVRNGGGR